MQCGWKLYGNCGLECFTFILWIMRGADLSLCCVVRVRVSERDSCGTAIYRSAITEITITVLITITITVDARCPNLEHCHKMTVYIQYIKTLTHSTG